MSIKIISNDKKRVTIELTIDLDGENFLETEELIMDKVNDIGQILTKQAMENLDINEPSLFMILRGRECIQYI